MIQEDYVTFEQAKALKELGFPQSWRDVLVYFTSTKQDQIVGDSKFFELEDCYEAEWSEWVTAPTLSLVQKWLREEKGLYIEVTRWDQDEDPIEHGFYWEILDSTNYKKILAHCMEPLYSKPEHALSAGIDKCIELLKNSL